MWTKKVILFSHSFLLISFFEVLGFNIDIKHPIIYLDQTKYTNVSRSNKSSFFGMSVILFPGDESHSAWVQIGAPRGNSPSLRLRNPGIIFRCVIPTPCKYIEVTKASLFDGYNSHLDDAWIGATMDINWKYNRTVVCAPRWKLLDTEAVSYRMLGACYWANLTSTLYRRELPLLMTTSDDYIYQDKTHNVYNKALGQMGMSVHMPEDEKEMFIGAPGVYDWKGSTMVYRDAVIRNHPSAYRSYDNQISEDEPKGDFNYFNLGNARLTKNLQAHSYFGYAVTSGHFFSRTQLHYAGGAPRSKQYHGQVFIIQFGLDTDEEFNIWDIQNGTQFGEYFGAALAAGDINQDGYDDLFVGAPYHCSSKYNEGRMYLYLGSSNGSLQEPVRGHFKDGIHNGGQFGSAITYLGDMNRDGNRYVAVSAPYAEEGSGVVYIFRGLSKSYGIDTIPVQTIIGNSFLPEIRGFGISISKPADIDANGYKDIAVGAYQSGHVVLLRSRPLVKIRSYFSQIPTSISSNDKEFTVQLCHSYTSYGGMRAIEITRKITVDEYFQRAYLLAKKETEPLLLIMDRPTCEDLLIKLHENLENTYDSLTLSVTHYYMENMTNPSHLLIGNSVEGSDKFCTRCGVYDKYRSIQANDERIPFSLGCGSDNVCISVLDFNTSFIISGIRTDTFILGSTNNIDIETEVRNSGEKAYLLRVQVDLPDELTFKKKPTLCDQNNRTRITCPLANALDKGEKETFSLKLDMEYVNKMVFDNSLYINITVLTNSQNTNEAFKRVKLYLRTEADITISGESDEQSYVYGNDSHSNVEFKQTYWIGKFGSSTVSSIAFQILVPYAIKSETENRTFISLYQPEGSFKGQLLSFTSNLPFLDEQKLTSSKESGLEEIEEVRRKRYLKNSEVVYENTRETEMKSSNLEDETADSDLMGKTTYEINCNSTEVLCGKIYGSTGPFEWSKDTAVLRLRLLFDVKNLTGILPKNAIIKYSTIGMVEILNPSDLKQSGIRPDMTVVSSIFLMETSKKKVDTWIIVVSVLCGLLLLLLLTLGLTKAGFFKRATKEELEQLKAKTGYDEVDGVNNAGSEKSDLPKTE